VDRATATRLLVTRLTDEVVVSNLGQATRDLQRLGDRPLNCYTFGSMGQCSSIGLGIALARPDVRVICLDGDGSLLMNLGSLATIGWTRPANLVVVVWDNQSYATTGGQDTATAHGADLAAAGGELTDALSRAASEDGPWVIVAKVDESAPTVKPPLDCVFIKNRFMSSQA
jgi:thiamine pyrophosphate-dependent acetolactate synthase large subunit-like protein